MEDTPNISLSDIHVHLQDKRFGSTVELVLNRAFARGVMRFVCSGTSPADWSDVVCLGKEYAEILTTLGLHPWYASKVGGTWENYLESLLQTPSKNGFLPAVGEAGLDLAMAEPNLPVQEKVLLTQLDFAQKYRRPIVLHSVRATDRILTLLKDFPKIPLLLFHGFTGSKEQVQRIVALEGFFSFSRRQVQPTFKRGIETVFHTPLDRMLLESDCPSLFPTREVLGTAKPLLRVDLQDDGFFLDEPAQLIQTASEIQKIKKISPEDFFQAIQKNEQLFFQEWKSAAK